MIADTILICLLELSNLTVNNSDEITDKVNGFTYKYEDTIQYN